MFEVFSLWLEFKFDALFERYYFVVLYYMRSVIKKTMSQ